VEQFIASFVREEVSRAQTQTRYREPLIGFADADDPRFAQLRAIAEPTHLLPCDLLPGARSAVSFFLPFAREVVRANRQDSRDVAPEWSCGTEWATPYLETNELIDHMSRRLIATLQDRGVKAAAEPPTHNFDPDLLKARWSHKSVAAIAGLGSFGLHHMLITDAGCAGRFGSVVVDSELGPTSSPSDPHLERCRYFQSQSCRACVERCPVGALTETGLDKHRCHERLLLTAAYHFRELGLTDVCGKCATGPCALASAV
jgi:epoxyqueuosine reductase QueG